jgi:hypothetical protein
LLFVESDENQGKPRTRGAPVGTEVKTHRCLAAEDFAGWRYAACWHEPIEVGVPVTVVDQEHWAEDVRPWGHEWTITCGK